MSECTVMFLQIPKSTSEKEKPGEKKIVELCKEFLVLHLSFIIDPPRPEIHVTICAFVHFHPGNSVRGETVHKIYADIAKVAGSD